MGLKLDHSGLAHPLICASFFRSVYLDSQAILDFIKDFFSRSRFDDTLTLSTTICLSGLLQSGELASPFNIQPYCFCVTYLPNICYFTILFIFGIYFVCLKEYLFQRYFINLLSLKLTCRHINRRQISFNIKSISVCAHYSG